MMRKQVPFAKNKARNAVPIYVQTCSLQVGIVSYGFAIHPVEARQLHSVPIPL